MKRFFKENETSKIEEAIFIAEIENEIIYFNGDWDCGTRGTDHAVLYSQFDIEPKELDSKMKIICVCPETKILICSENTLNYFKNKIDLKHLKQYKHKTWG